MLSFKVFVLASSFLVLAVVEAKSFQNSGRTRTVATPLIRSAPSNDEYSENQRAARQAAAEPKPEPYSFTFETTDEFGTTLTRTESGDENGVVKGSYMYRDAQGIYRTVEYSDNGDGFNANVQTNEPGVISHKPADAEYIKN